ncbi:MAG: CHASE2 domain-containing protein, partial [Acidobacteriota bacterium]
MRKLLVGVGLGLGAAALVLLLGLTGLFETVELKLYDWRMRLAADTRNPNPDIVLVEINDASIRDLSPVAGRWPWPRLIQSNLIDFLSQARVVAYDVTLSERTQGTFQYADRAWTGDESDREMVKSVGAAGNVIMLADAVFAGADEGQAQSVKPAEWRAPGYRLGPAIEERPLILPPFQALTDAAAGLGHNFLPLDPDGPARRMPPFIRSGERYLPSLGIAAALKWGGFRPDEIVLDGGTIRVRDRRIPLVPVRVESAATGQPAHDQQTMLINYRAPVLVNHTRPFRTYEARHLLISQDQISSGQPPLVDPAVFKDKLVFVGMTTSGLVDVFQTPFGSELMPGIQLHASMADSLLSNRFLRPAPDSSRLAATLAGAVIVGLMSTMLPFVAGSVGAASFAGA